MSVPFIEGQVVEGATVVSQLQLARSRVHDAVLEEVTRLTEKATAGARRRAGGEVLDVRTGDLLRAIGAEVTEYTTTISGKVALDPFEISGWFWEWGGKLARGRQLYSWHGGLSIKDKTGRYRPTGSHPRSDPARPWIRPSIAEVMDEFRLLVPLAAQQALNVDFGEV